MIKKGGGYSPHSKSYSLLRNHKIRGSGFLAQGNLNPLEWLKEKSPTKDEHKV